MGKGGMPTLKRGRIWYPSKGADTGVFPRNRRVRERWWNIHYLTTGRQGNMHNQALLGD